MDEPHVLVLGVGPAVQPALLFGRSAGALGAAAARRLTVCQTTEPATLAALSFEETFVVVAARSGRRRESRMLFDYARSRLRDDRRIAVLSAEGSPLARRAEELRVQRLFAVPPLPAAFDALSILGAVPAALLGYELEELFGRALEIDRRVAIAEGLALAEAVSGGAPALGLDGDAAAVDAVVSILDAALPAEGRGLFAYPERAGRRVADAEHRELAPASPLELGALLSHWQLAAAVAAYALDADPFATGATAPADEIVATLLDALPLEEAAVSAPEALGAFLEEERSPRGALFIQGYLPDEAADSLAALGDRISSSSPLLPVRTALAPATAFLSARLTRFGPPLQILQLVGRTAAPPLPVPHERFDFAALSRARALADEQVLRGTGRPVLRLAVDDPGELM